MQALKPSIAARNASADVENLILSLSMARGIDEVMAIVRQDLRGLVGADGVTFVLREDGRTLSVFGASGQQGQLGFSGRHYSLTDALAAAGGLIAQRAYPKGVFVYRTLSAGPERQEVVYHFDLAEVQGTFYASEFSAPSALPVLLTPFPASRIAASRISI